MIDRINERWSVDCSSLVDTSGYQILYGGRWPRDGTRCVSEEAADY